VEGIATLCRQLETELAAAQAERDEIKMFMALTGNGSEVDRFERTQTLERELAAYQRDEPKKLAELHGLTQQLAAAQAEIAAGQGGTETKQDGGTE